MLIINVFEYHWIEGTKHKQDHYTYFLCIFSNLKNILCFVKVWLLSLIDQNGSRRGCLEIIILLLCSHNSTLKWKYQGKEQIYCPGRKNFHKYIAQGDNFWQLDYKDEIVPSGGLVREGLIKFLLIRKLHWDADWTIAFVREGGDKGNAYDDIWQARQQTRFNCHFSPSLTSLVSGFV